MFFSERRPDSIILRGSTHKVEFTAVGDIGELGVWLQSVVLTPS